VAVGQKLRLFTGLLNEFYQIKCENFVVAYPMKKNPKSATAHHM
jgi:hypothetical protein